MRALDSLAILLVLSAAADASRADPRHSEDRYLDNSDGQDWPGYGRTFGEQHYTPLAQIGHRNLKRLGLAWMLEVGPQSVWTQPIAVDGILYFASGLSLVHAVDAASGKLLWRYDPKAAEKAGINLRFGWGSRGIAWWNGRIYAGTQDGRLIAIDARTGTPAWSVQTIDADTAAYISGAPRAFDGKVIIGFGSDTGKNRGYVTAYDAETGEKLWRFFTVPGDPAKGFEDDAMKTAASTWAGKWWEFGGGGAVWNAIAYDPESDTIFIGVGGGYPGNRRVRSADQGDNLFLTSIVALDGKTGAYKWHYQTTPGDTWDYDAAMDIELADLTFGGKVRKVLMQAPKNGFFYVIDRLTGELLSAEPYVKVTWAHRIDSKTGRPIERAGARYSNGKEAIVWPSGSTGGHGWAPMAYSPRSRLVYLPVIEAAEKLHDRDVDATRWHAPTDRTVDGPRGFMAASVKPDGAVSTALIAWNPLSAKVVWKVHGAMLAGGAMATGGDLVFQGDGGVLKAFAAESGRELWSFDTQAAAISSPISYAVQGKQYVTVLTSPSKVGAVSVRVGMDPSRPPRHVLTFALDGNAMLAVGESAVRPEIEDPEFRPDAARAEAGRVVYMERCVYCHDDYARTHAPDLRRSAIPISQASFELIVRNGVFVAKGMPAFGDLTDEQLTNLRQYIRSNAQRLRNEKE